jgi:hypothetical protein
MKVIAVKEKKRLISRYLLFSVTTIKKVQPIMKSLL